MTTHSDIQGYDCVPQSGPGPTYSSRLNSVLTNYTAESYPVKYMY